jgi:DNA-binding NarL/FixJ family response regulator
MAIRLVAVDEHVLLRLGLARVVAGCPDIELVGEAASAAEAVPVVAGANADVVTIDASLADSDGIALARQLRATAPDLGVVLLSAVNDDTLLYRALDAGLSAYVTKAGPTSSVLVAIRHAAIAPHSFSAPGLQAALSRRRGQAGLLSQREREVLSLMRDGLSLPTIAHRLEVSEATVKTYVSRLYSKLRVNNRSQALMAAANQGLFVSADAA